MKSLNSSIKKRQKIINHYSNPINIIKNTNGYIQINANFDNTSCSDIIKLFYKITNQEIEDIKFQGIGCSISIASTDIFISLINGKSKSEIFEVIKIYENLINKKKYNRKIKDLNIFQNVSIHSNRKNCALIVSNTVKKILEEI